MLAHAADSAVRSVAVLDAVLNNSDRKGLHLVRVDNGVRGFDHGVSLGCNPNFAACSGVGQATRCPAPMSTARPTPASALSEPILRARSPPA